MSQPKLLYLSQADIGAVGLTMREIIDALEVAFKEKGRDGCRCRPSRASTGPPTPLFTPCRPTSALESARAEMGERVSRIRSAGCPISPACWSQRPADGAAASVMDCVWITATHQAATALAAKHLAARLVQRGHLGLRRPGAHQLLALKELFPLTSARAYDIHAERAQATPPRCAKDRHSRGDGGATATPWPAAISW
jgi:ornithine cyclodeaminase/alanine dehydrogenase-like protein (mu-crystallin family)